MLNGGGVKDSETPSGGVFQPFLEGSRTPLSEGGNGMYSLNKWALFMLEGQVLLNNL